MYSTELEIQDQAYQFFKQEAPEFLQTIETGLLCLREDRSTANIHSIMRAAHSIKGGSASLNLEGIKTIAHQLEDVFRSLYRFEGEIDGDVEGLLLQAYDCLRIPLMDQLQSGHYESASAIAAAEPIFEVLKMYFGEIDEDAELPTAAELGVDIIQIVFDGDVQQGILRLQNVLANPEGVPVTGEIRAQVEVFNGIGELLNLSGFKAIADATLAALEHHPDQPILVGEVAVANFIAARAAVLAGDRAQGGKPSPELIALGMVGDLEPQEVELANYELPNLDTSDDWIKSLEQEIDGFDFLDNSPDLSLDLSLDPITSQPLETIFTETEFTESDRPDTLTAIADLNADSNVISDLITHVQNFDDFDPVAFTSIAPKTSDLGNPDLENPDLEHPDLEHPDLEQINQDFDIFTTDLETKANGQEANIFDNLNSVFSLLEFDDSEENLLVDALVETVDTASELTPPNLIEPNLSSPPAPEAMREIAPEVRLAVTPKINELTSQLGKSELGKSNLAKAKTSTEITNKKTTTEKVTPYIAETVRVDLPRLERLNNFSSELVTQENASMLQNQQLQSKIERIQKQFKGFENLSKNLQTWLDKAQRSQVKTQDDSINNLANLSLSKASATASSLLADFDPLQMDSYNRLHSVIQEALEEIAQMDEGMRDMTILMQQKQQTQRRKQQILKQVRYDLLWSRMLPLGDILSSLPRMVRELSHKYNKQVNLKLFGTGTLVDKSVLEKLYDPFVHLVRNAFDHGTESTQERLDLGKPVMATIEIRAYYRGNQTYIEIKDDGYGIDTEKVKAKAIAVGLLKSAQANQISNEEVYQFLFAPSFSTAEVVSELSGRGMGLSTVQEQVRSLKGSIEIKSEAGLGTNFIIKLPLTLSIAKLLIFIVQERLVAIAIDTLVGIITVESNAIQIIQGKEFFRFEDRLIPLYPTSIFADGYPLPKKSLELLNPESFGEENQTTLLLLSDGDQISALPIDRVINEQELAVKPFGKAIAPPSYIYGCTVLGDGSLVPVIDSTALLALNLGSTANQSSRPALISSANSSVNASVNASDVQSPTSELKTTSLQRRTLLIVDDSLTARQALYMTLEKFGYQVIQAADGREALEQLSRSPEIQAVICDVEMPVMNGFEFLTACRKENRYANLPIVMLTSRSGAKHRGVAEMLGASGYHTKPYLEQQLIKTIQGLLNPN
jgi:chemotaxis family two-component system sensor histidine kinase/response regulator PixL